MHPLHSRCAIDRHARLPVLRPRPDGRELRGRPRRSRARARGAARRSGSTGYPKTSGATGIQIYVPIEPGWSYDQVRDFVGTLGRMIERADREHVTMAWQIDKRTGKVFIDHNMNRSGREHLRRLLAATRAGRHGLDAADVGRGRGGRHPAGLPDRQRLGAVREARRPVRGRADRTAAGRSRPRSRRSGCRRRSAIERADGTARRTVRGGDRRLEGPEPGASTCASGRSGPRERPSRARAAAEGAGNSFVIHKHRATRLHYDVPARARRRARLVGRAAGPADASPATSAWPSGPRTTRSSTGRSRARSPRATTARARSGSSTTAGTSRSSGPTRR